MNEHFNKATREYRYRAYNLKTKKFKEIIKKRTKHQNDSVMRIDNIEHFVIKHNYRPYFIYRLFWWLSKPIIYLSSLNTNQKIKIIGITIGSIVSISLAVIGWLFF